MKGDREMAELVNDATNRPMEALSRIRLPNGNGRMGQNAQKQANTVEVEFSRDAKYQKLYTQYLQGVEATSPVEKTLAVARNAARDGQSVEVIVNMLRNDPKAQQFGDKSEQFIQTVSQAAVRKNQAESSSLQAQSGQKTPTLER
jgi:hypothetical protein